MSCNDPELTSRLREQLAPFLIDEPAPLHLALSVRERKGVGRPIHHLYTTSGSIRYQTTDVSALGDALLEMLSALPEDDVPYVWLELRPVLRGDEVLVLHPELLARRGCLRQFLAAGWSIPNTATTCIDPTTGEALIPTPGGTPGRPSAALRASVRGFLLGVENGAITRGTCVRHVLNRVVLAGAGVELTEVFDPLIDLVLNADLALAEQDEPTVIRDTIDELLRGVGRG